MAYFYLICLSKMILLTFEIGASYISCMIEALDVIYCLVLCSNEKDMGFELKIRQNIAEQQRVEELLDLGKIG